MNNILIIADTYNPDKTSGAKLLQDLTENLKKNQNIFIICARDKKIKNYKEKNINLININCGFIKSKNFFVRGIYEFIMPFSIWFRLKRQIKKIKPNLLICYSPSIFFYYFCKKVINNFNCKSFLILRDIFPLWAIQAKIINNIILQKYLLRYLKNFCNLFNTIGLESKSNIKYLKELGIKKKIIFFPNWINLSKNKNFIKKKNNNFIFSGNLGQGQDPKKIIDFFSKLEMYYLNTEQKYNFTILGDGSEKKNFLTNKNKIKIHYKKKIKYNKFISFLKKFNFGIISLRDEIKTVNYPGKLLTYLMTNTITINLSNKKNELSNFIKKNKIGISISSNDDIEKKIKELEKLQNLLGKNKSHFERILKKNFSTDKACLRILKIAKHA